MFHFNNKQNQSSQNPADILYGETERRRKDDEAKRNKLLNRLNGKLSQAQILYSTNEELEKKSLI